MRQGMQQNIPQPRKPERRFKASLLTPAPMSDENCAFECLLSDSHSDTFSSESLRNNPSPRTSAAGTHPPDHAAGAPALSVESSPAGSRRVKPTSACTSRKRSISTTLSIHGRTFPAGSRPELLNWRYSSPDQVGKELPFRQLQIFGSERSGAIERLEA
jgi:hypothetical protein